MNEKRLHYQRDHHTPVDISVAVALDNILCALAALIQPTRSEVAKVIEANGLGAYIGGRHVTIHSIQPSTKMLNHGPIAYITANYGEWL